MLLLVVVVDKQYSDTVSSKIIIRVCIINQTWLGVRCHPEVEFKPLLFSHSWTNQGPESTC